MTVKTILTAKGLLAWSALAGVCTLESGLGGSGCSMSTRDMSSMWRVDSLA